MEEAVLVWLIERSVTKDRILELYLNCIEYGPEIYGIQKASRRYFGKSASRLTPLEGAFLMGLKPSPPSGWHQLRRGRVSARWRRKLGRILKGMAHRDWLSQRAFEAARPYDPVFITSTHGEKDLLDEEGEEFPPRPNDM